MTVRPLSAALKKKAEKEINEDERRLASDIIALRDWMKKQPHLESIQPTDPWIVAFLRGCKFSLERTKQKLDMYYTLKGLVPEFLSNRDPLDPKIQEMLKLGLFLPLKRCKDEDSCRICIVRVGAFNHSLYHLTDVLKISFMISEIMMLEDDNFNVAGEVLFTYFDDSNTTSDARPVLSKPWMQRRVRNVEEIIVDMKGVGINILSQWTPALAKKTTSCFEKAFPVRVRSTYIINTPSGFEAAYAILKTFLGEKLKKRIKVFNQDYKAIYHAVPQSTLPVEYGGQDGSLQELIDYWKLKVESYRDWFLTQEIVKSDERLRPGAPKTTSALFGVEGSFRALQVD